MRASMHACVVCVCMWCLCVYVCVCMCVCVCVYVPVCCIRLYVCLLYSKFELVKFLLKPLFAMHVARFVICICAD